MRRVRPQVLIAPRRPEDASEPDGSRDPQRTLNVVREHPIRGEVTARNGKSLPCEGRDERLFPPPRAGGVCAEAQNLLR